HRADVYALGATLYELLTLRPAFEGTDRTEILRKITSEEPVAPRKLNRAIPADLETVLLKALSKEAHERYATAQEFAQDLRRWLGHEPIRARRATLRQRGAKWLRRHRALAWTVGGAVAAVVMVLALAAGYVARDRQTRQAELVLRAEVALDETERLYRQGRWQEAREAARRTTQLLPLEGEAGPPAAPGAAAAGGA